MSSKERPSYTISQNRKVAIELVLERAASVLGKHLEFGIGKHQPFAARRIEIDLHSRTCALPFVVEHDALAELAMDDALT